MQTKPPPEPHFSIWVALWRAPLLQRPFWQDVIFRWRGWGILYLHLVVVIVWLPITAELEWRLMRFVEDDAAEWVEGFPGFYIEAGTVYTDVRSQPYTWNDPDTGQPLFVVDTTGQVTSLDGRAERFLLTRDTLFVRNAGGMERETPLGAVPFFVMDEHLLLLMLQDARLYFPILFYLCAFLVSVTWRCLQAVGYGAIGWGMGGFGKVPFGAGMRIAAMAITTVLWLDMVEDLLPIDVPGWGLICFVIALVYIAWGVKVAKEGPPEDVAEWRRGAG
ncbi:MAG TPA: DUF1189 family protein [Myxococcota bacterium]|nr:DUF1189 family protein [Myxococcota bacterium]